jgi:hypothetical protein
VNSESSEAARIETNSSKPPPTLRRCGLESRPIVERRKALGTWGGQGGLALGARACGGSLQAAVGYWSCVRLRAAMQLQRKCARAVHMRTHGKDGGGGGPGHRLRVLARHLAHSGGLALPLPCLRRQLVPQLLRADARLSSCRPYCTNLAQGKLPKTLSTYPQPCSKATEARRGGGDLLLDEELRGLVAPLLADPALLVEHGLRPLIFHHLRHPQG